MNKSLIASVIACVGVSFTCHATYTQLQWMNATGTEGKQWVNTGYTPAYTDRIECKFRPRSTSGSMTLWCARGKGTTTAEYVLFIMTGGKPRCDQKNQVDGITSLTVTADALVEVNGKEESWTVNDTLQPSFKGGTGERAGSSMSLFASHTAGADLSPSSTMNNWADIVFYYLKVFDADGNLLHHYVPAQDDDAAEDSKARYGVLDLAVEPAEFLPNLGTVKAFEPGPMVAPPPGIDIRGEDDLGALDPAVGKYELDDGAWLVCRALAATNRSVWVRSRATGYTLETFDAPSGSWGEPAPYDGDRYDYRQVGETVRRLIWRWSHEARLTANCNAADGQVSVAGGAAGATSEGWAELGGTLSATAIDSVPAYTFNRWTGDVPAEQVRQRTISVPLDAAKRVTAVFAPAGDVAALTAALAAAADGDTIVVPPGVYKLTAQLTISKPNVTLRGNDADPSSVVLDGGGACRCLLTQQKGVTLSGLTFRGGYRNGDGGGVYCNYATVTNCHFEGNLADAGSGGGIYARDGATIIDCAFDDNVASNRTSGGYGGGGIYHYDKSGVIRGCTFRRNKVVNGNCNCGGGAAIKASRGADWVIRDCTFTGHSANYGVITGVPRLITDCVFSNDQTTAAFLFNADVGTSVVTTTLVQRCIVRDTASRAFQGRAGYGRIRFDGCQFVSCGMPGAVNMSCIYEVDQYTGGTGNGILSMSNCVVRSFSTGAKDGASIIGSEKCADIYGCTFDDVYCYQGNSAITLGHNARFANSKFINGRFGMKNNLGCAVQIAGTNVTIESCLFVSNQTRQAGGTAIYMGLGGDNYWARIDNCTFAYNHTGGSASSNYGGTITLTTNSLVRNCLFYRNTAAKANRSVYNNNATGVGVDACTNCFVNCWEADDCTQLKNSPGCTVDNATDLKFVDPDPYTSCNFEIAKDSPLVDKGVDLDWIGPRTLDVRNDRHYKRLYGEHPDIGAYEFGRLPGLLLFVR